MGGRNSRHMWIDDWDHWDDDWHNNWKNDYDYLVEYAKSGRSKCRFCHLPIKNLSLRFTTVIPSSLFRERTSGWYHFDCFFKEQKPSSIDEIGYFYELRDEDQNTIRKKIEEYRNTPVPPAIGRKRTNSYSDGRYSNFRVEYAKSSRSMCMGCLRNITKGQTRISKKDHKSKKAKRLGGLERWHHVECFAKFRADIGYYGSGDELPGAAQLSEEDQQSLKVLLPRVPRDYTPSPPKRMNYSPEDVKKEMLMKTQTEELYALKDRISSLEMQDMIALLEENHQKIPSGTSNIISRLSDILYFGALQPCPQCKGQLEYNFGLGYKCTGNAAESTRCEYVTQDPKREECVIPSEMMKKSPLKSYKPEVKKRLFTITASPSSSFILNEGEIIILDD